MTSGGRVFAISDLHVDYVANRQFVDGFSASEFLDDTLIVAGDVTDNLDLLQSTLRGLAAKYRDVFYVPGNHELWLRPDDSSVDSVAKFHAILRLCERVGVHTRPRCVSVTPAAVAATPLTPDCATSRVWVVPLFSWYATPEDDAADSLFVPPSVGTDDPARQTRMWMDTHLCVWPAGGGDGRDGESRAAYFSRLNDAAVATDYDAPVISFSHFVPRFDLIPTGEDDRHAVDREREHLRLPPILDSERRFQGSKGFNFTRFAGSRRLQAAVVALSSAVHVYGHQHRNRDRVVGGVRYVAHCLGSVACQRAGWTWGVRAWAGPKQVWPRVPDALTPPG